MSDKNKPNNTERLEKLCGFDPAKPLNANGSLLAEVIKELREEREEKAKVSAKEQLGKAVGLREKMIKVKREFESQTSKFDKELGKLLNRLEAGLRGEAPPTEDTETE